MPAADTKAIRTYCQDGFSFPSTWKAPLMWRAFFLALGIYACIFGAECMVIESYVMASESAVPAQQTSLFQASGSPTISTREWKPPEWAPWSLLSTGAIVILYSLTLNRPG